MILQDDTLQTIINAVSVANTFKIEPLLISKKNIIGLDAALHVAIFVSTDLDIGCEEIGILSPISLNNKLKIIDDNSVCSVKYDDETSYAKYIHIKSKKFNIEYRCANTRAIKVPKSLGNNTEDYYQINIDEEMVNDLNKCKNAMKCKTANKNITIMCDNNQIKYKLYGDDNNESLVYDGGFVELVEDYDDSVNFIYTYPIEYFFNMIKNCEDKFYMTKNGMIHFIHSSIDVFLIPHK
jgi:hypothetical protein